MKNSIISILIVLILFSCDRIDTDDLVVRNPYLILGNISACNVNSFRPFLRVSDDSIDINNDLIYDFKLFTDDVYIDDCDEFYENCPPEVICDCWPIIYYDYSILNKSDIEIAMDSKYNYPLQLIEGDTINDNNFWASKYFNILFHNDAEIGEYGHWTEQHEGYLGIRLVENKDTIYGWLIMELDSLKITLKEIALQK